MICSPYLISTRQPEGSNFKRICLNRAFVVKNLLTATASAVPMPHSSHTFSLEVLVQNVSGAIEPSVISIVSTSATWRCEPTQGAHLYVKPLMQTEILLILILADRFPVCSRRRMFLMLHENHQIRHLHWRPDHLRPQSWQTSCVVNPYQRRSHRILFLT